jgi:putative nucleotidyltransferase with HDIG domain
MEQIKISELVSALSYALDLTEGQPMGHSARVCILGMRIAAEIGMELDRRAELYYTLLIKDAGCSSNASRMFHIIAADEVRAKADVKTTDWTRIGWDSLQYALGHVATGRPLLERIRTLARVARNRPADSHTLVKVRCERGASVALQMGFSQSVADGIYSLDEQWNGAGYPNHLRGDAIPLFSRIALLAQTLEVFWRQAGPDGAIAVARQRSGRWFDPLLVRAAASLARRGALWAGLESPTLLDDVQNLEPVEFRLALSSARMDSICQALAEVVDAKSPFTYRHSTGVADAAVKIARTLALPESSVVTLRRAALLHDIGKLSVPNTILEKPGKLDEAEWQVVKRHPFYSYEILRRIPGFATLSEIAACHHERLDGNGYFRGYDATQLSLSARILAVADVYDALAARRPYRDALPLEKVFAIMDADAGRALDPAPLAALKHATGGLPQLAAHLAPDNSRIASPSTQA